MTYTVQAGDTLSKIASRNGLTLAELLRENPQITDPNRIKLGDIINVPDESITTQETKPLPPPPTAAATGAIGEAFAEELGSLSAKYETGGRGPGVVSTGAGDPGGVSYGSYQMASKMGVVQRFVGQNGFPWAKDFQNLTAGSAQFTAVWKRIAAEQTAAFQGAQHEFIKQSHYDQLAAKVLGEDALDVNTRSRALQNVIWSTAVQHGGASSIVHRAIGTLSCATSDPTYDQQLVCAIYAERGRKKPDGNLAYFSKSSPNVQAGVAKRFQNEQKDALAMLAGEA